MATVFNSSAKNVMLEALKSYSAGGTTTISVGLYPSGGASTAEIARGTATYGTASGGSMALTSNVVINVPAGNTVAIIKLLKNSYPNDWVIVTKDITPEVFTYAGTLTITSATISLADPT